MAELENNRDLYQFISGLVRQRGKTQPTLAVYLENLRQLAQVWRGQEVLRPSDFVELLALAFESAPPLPPDLGPASQAFLRWDQRLGQQLLDLQQMKEAGILDDEHRYFGVDAPSGRRWYNFDPATFLECAVAGTFGGWQEGDDTGRTYVPGPVAVLDAAGSLSTADPRELDEPVVTIHEICWEAFEAFLEAGQTYE